MDCQEVERRSEEAELERQIFAFVQSRSSREGESSKQQRMSTSNDDNKHITPSSSSPNSIQRNDIGAYCPLTNIISTPSAFYRTHLITVQSINRQQLEHLLRTAQYMERAVDEQGSLQCCAGLVQANLFYEPSTRTNCSFSAAMLRLGGKVINVSEATSSAAKGESLEDTVRCLQSYCNLIVMRHPEVH